MCRASSSCCAENGAEVVAVVVGTIPEDDADELRKLGVFGPGAPIGEIVEFVFDNLCR